jgi:hypothetical protein
VGVLALVFFMLAGQPISGLLTFLLFHLGGVGVREHNPFAAAVLLAYYLIAFLASPGIAFVRVIVTALLVSNLRATWIAGNWKPDSEEAALPLRLRDTFFDKLSSTSSPTAGRPLFGRR